MSSVGSYWFNNRAQRDSGKNFKIETQWQLKEGELTMGNHRFAQHELVLGIRWGTRSTATWWVGLCSYSKLKLVETAPHQERDDRLTSHKLRTSINHLLMDILDWSWLPRDVFTKRSTISKISTSCKDIHFVAWRFTTGCFTCWLSGISMVL